jgi:uncharacterized RDD family membrane protein YckC
MQQVAIHTPQNVEIGFPTAELGKRMLAKFVDYVILFALSWILSEFLDTLLHPSFKYDYWSEMAISALVFLPVYTYSLWFETLLGGSTPGKMVMKIQVMRLDGLPYSWENALIRWMFTLIDMLPIFGITGFIAISATKNSQRLGDLAAGTVVISKKKEVGIDQTILLELNSDYQPIYAQVVRLSDNDMRIIKDSFDSAMKKNDFHTISKIREKVESVMQTADRGVNDINFIQTVMKDFNFYTNK